MVNILMVQQLQEKPIISYYNGKLIEFSRMLTHIHLYGIVVELQNFSRFVEVGRVVLINYGPDCGKVATVVDVVDNKRVSASGLLIFNLYY